MAHSKVCGGMEFINLFLGDADGTTGCHSNQPWTITFQDSPAAGVAEDFLDSLLSRSNSFSDPASPLRSPSTSDSGVGEDTPFDHLDSPYTPVPSQCLPQASPLLHLPTADVSIDLGWEPGDTKEKFGLSYYLTTSPNSQLSASHALTVKDLLLSNTGQKTRQNSQNSLRELVLSEDEKKLLAKEGVNLPNKLPLTKFEERVLKKIRRKIRNKRSARESRKKKREYVDSLEERMSACSTHNLQLQRKVHELQRSNSSLLEQLNRLQALLPRGRVTTSQAGTCLLVLFLSFSLLLSSSLQPEQYNRLNQAEDVEAKVPSRSLQSVVEPGRGPSPVSSAPAGVELSRMMEQLWSWTELPTSDSDVRLTHR